MVLADAESIGIADCMLGAGLTIAGIWATTSTTDGVTFADVDSTIFAGPVLVTYTVSVLIAAGELSAEETISSTATIAA